MHCAEKIMAAPKDPSLDRFRQVEAHLRQQMASRRLAPGAKLPSFVALQEEFGVSTTSINRALLNLERDGLIERVRGSGVYVAETKVRQLLGTYGFIGSGVDLREENPNPWMEPYWTQLVAGAQFEAQRCEREMLLCTSPMRSWHKVDGVLVHSEKVLGSLDRLPLGMPAVGVMEAVRDHPSVVADDFMGAREATDHLIQLGHRRIGYMGFVESAIIQQRLAGYSTALFAAGIKPDSDWILTPHGYDFPSKYHHAHLNMKAWLEMGFLETGITALLVQEDRFVGGVATALAECGLRVPEDLSVVGFDGLMGPLATGQVITTVRIPLEKIGRQAMRLLDRWVQGDNPGAITITEPVRFIAGQTSGPAPLQPFSRRVAPV